MICIKNVLITEKNNKEEEMKVDAELFDLCKEFIKENKISCEEDIFQNDSVQEEMLELMEQICDLIGYYDHQEEEFEEE